MNERERMPVLIFYGGFLVAAVWIMSVFAWSMSSTQSLIAEDMVSVLATMEKQKINITTFTAELRFLKARTDFNTIAIAWYMISTLFVGAIILLIYVSYASGYKFWYLMKRKKTLKERLETIEKKLGLS